MLDDVTIFDSQVGKYALSFAWRKFGKKIHVLAFAKHLCYALVYSLSLFLFARLTNNVDMYSSTLLQSRAAFAWFLQGLSIAGVYYFMHHESLQFQTEFEGNVIEYLQDMWNINDLCMHSTFLVGTMLRVVYQHESVASRNMLSVCALFMYFKVLYYLRAFELTGPLVAMIFQIVKDMIPFCLVLFIALFGFSHSFWIISLEDISLPFGVFQNALLNSFNYMFGMIVLFYCAASMPLIFVSSV